MKTYAYIRVSTDKQTVENQRNAINAAGYQIDEWMEDQGVSGVKDWHKRDIANTLKRAERGDRIIVAELSRLGRSLRQILEIIETCQTNGVTLIILRENMQILSGGDPTTKLLIAIFGALAEMERDLIAMRTKDALALRREQGVTLGRPSGKKTAIEKRKLYDKEDIIKALMRRGYSRSEIARYVGVNRNTLINYCRQRGGSLWTLYNKAPVTRRKKIVK